MACISVTSILEDASPSDVACSCSSCGGPGGGGGGQHLGGSSAANDGVGGGGLLHSVEGPLGLTCRGAATAFGPVRQLLAGAERVRMLAHAWLCAGGVHGTHCEAKGWLNPSTVQCQPALPEYLLAAQVKAVPVTPARCVDGREAPPMTDCSMLWRAQWGAEQGRGVVSTRKRAPKHVQACPSACAAHMRVTRGGVLHYRPGHAERSWCLAGLTCDVCTEARSVLAARLMLLLSLSLPPPCPRIFR
jgi:hypothetical protein